MMVAEKVCRGRAEPIEISFDLKRVLTLFLTKCVERQFPDHPSLQAVTLHDDFDPLLSLLLLMSLSP
jgi:hypothetical protein